MADETRAVYTHRASWVHAVCDHWEGDEDEWLGGGAGDQQQTPFPFPYPRGLWGARQAIQSRVEYTQEWWLGASGGMSTLVCCGEGSARCLFVLVHRPTCRGSAWELICVVVGGGES